MPVCDPALPAADCHSGLSGHGTMELWVTLPKARPIS
jgi:hypothetical protein